MKEGINDGFLTPFKAKQIATTLEKYVYTPDDAVIEGDIEAGKRRRARRAVPARLSGQRENHSDNPDHIAEAVHRGGRAQCTQHCADAAVNRCFWT
jgi:hypothetical protein